MCGQIRVEPEEAQGQTSFCTSFCEAALEANGRIEDGISSLAAATGTEINFKQLPCLSNLWCVCLYLEDLRKPALENKKHCSCNEPSIGPSWFSVVFVITLVKEIKILLFYYQQSEFPCCPFLTKHAWPSSALPWASLLFPTCLFLFRLVYMWQNLLKFSIFVVGLNL